MITKEEFIKLVDEKNPNFKQDAAYPLVLHVIETNTFLLGLKELAELWAKLEKEASAEADAELENLYKAIDERKKKEALKNTTLRAKKETHFARIIPLKSAFRNKH